MPTSFILGIVPEPLVGACVKRSLTNSGLLAKLRPIFLLNFLVPCTFSNTQESELVPIASIALSKY